MNKKGSGPSLTWILFAVAAFVAIIILSLSAYTDIVNQANSLEPGSVVTDSAFMQAYSNITGEQNTLDVTRSTFSDLSFTMVLKGIISVFQSLVGYGLGAIASMLQSVTIIQNIISVVQLAYPRLATLFWFITFVIIIYIAARYLKVVRQDAEEA